MEGEGMSLRYIGCVCNIINQKKETDLWLVNIKIKQFLKSLLETPKIFCQLIIARWLAPEQAQWEVYGF